MVEIRDNYSRLFPRESFQLIYASNYCISEFHGELLMNVKLFDGQYLLVLKMIVSEEGPEISNDEVFREAFPWVYDSKQCADVEKRRDEIYQKLSAVFAGYNVLVMLFKAGQSWSCPYAKAKANAVFVKDYGDHDIIVVLY